MSALRDLVGAGAGAQCAAPDARAGSSNPLGRFADAVLGDRKGKHPETRGALSGAPGNDFAAEFLSQQGLQGNLLGMDDPSQFSVLPGGAHPGMLSPGGADVAEFLRFRDQPGHGPGPVPIGPGPSSQGPGSRAPEHPALTRALHSAVASADSRSFGAPPPPMADLHLSPAEKTVIRARSAIMARHLHAESHDGAMRARLNDALSPLGVDPAPAGAMDGPRQFPGPVNHVTGVTGPGLGFAGAETAGDRRGAWEAASVANGNVDALTQAVARGVGQGWADDFADRLQVGDARATTIAVPGPGAGAYQNAHARADSRGEWAEEFSGVKGSSGSAWAGEFSSLANSRGTADKWAEEFSQAQTTAVTNRAAPLTATQAETAAQSRRVAETLRNDPDGKFQNSQFLQFMSRMSHGEIVVDGNEVVETVGLAGPDAQQSVGAKWGDEFASEQARNGGWAREFAAGGQASTSFGGPPGNASAIGGETPGEHRWADEFADVSGGDWASEFQEMASRGEAGEWSHDSVWNQIESETKSLRDAERNRYEFVDPNPYLGRADAMSVGRELFRRGVLSEAALALEAVVRADMNSCEGQYFPFTTFRLPDRPDYSSLFSHTYWYLLPWYQLRSHTTVPCPIPHTHHNRLTLSF